MYDAVRVVFFFQAEDGIRDLVRSRGLGDVYKRQIYNILLYFEEVIGRQINFNKLNYKLGKDQKREKYLSLIHI